MTSELVERSVAEFSRLLAADLPVPGSGSGTAAIGALGAALASMALRAGRGEAPPGALRLDELRARLLAAVDEDARAYSAYRAARAGEGDLSAALRASIDVPRAVVTLALEALELLRAGVGEVRPRLRSEAWSATWALLASLEGASFTARSNLPGLEAAAERVRHERELAEQLTRGSGLARELHALLLAPLPTE